MDASRIYVVGHANPDTDSIASAIGYAWLLRERDTLPAIAAKAGSLNPQTIWVIEHFDLEPPVLLADISPCFDWVARRLPTATPSQPLRKAWAIATAADGVAPVVDDEGVPFGLLTGPSLFAFLSRLLGPDGERESMSVRAIMDLPCAEAVDTDAPCYGARAHIRDFSRRITRDERDYFFAVDDEGRYAGVCRYHDVLNPPRLGVVLVDHNEPAQSVGALEEGHVVGVLDHHRLGNDPTSTPIRFAVDVVGSTCTLVCEQIRAAGLRPPAAIAGALLAGVMADTLVLTSPTSVERDEKAASQLLAWGSADGGPLAGETVSSFGKEVLQAGADISTRDPGELVTTDVKRYEAGSLSFTISQVEVVEQVPAGVLEGLGAALEKLRSSSELAFAMLMVTDVVAGDSIVLVANPPPQFIDLHYTTRPDETLFAKGVVSRKKQLLPTVLGLLEG